MSHHPNWYLSGINNFTSFVNRKFLVNHICSDYLILFVTLIFFSLRHGNISRGRLDLGTFGTFFFPYLKLSIIFISFFFLFSFFNFLKVSNKRIIMSQNPSSKEKLLLLEIPKRNQPCQQFQRENTVPERNHRSKEKSTFIHWILVGIFWDFWDISILLFETFKKK